jgi:hypothetical protein
MLLFKASRIPVRNLQSRNRPCQFLAPRSLPGAVDARERHMIEEALRESGENKQKSGSDARPELAEVDKETEEISDIPSTAA